MTRNEFEELRDLPDKIILGDIEFLPSSNPDIYRFESKVDNQLGYDVIVNGTYNRLIPSLTYNFRITGVGAVCRYCVNGKLHKDYITRNMTRTHKHSLQNDTCPSLNLPYARERNDLDIATQHSVIEIWEAVCSEANIFHQGKLIIR